jgi:hypothetical protein
VGVCKGYDSIGVREFGVLSRVPVRGEIKKAGRRHSGNFEKKIA